MEAINKKKAAEKEARAMIRNSSNNSWVHLASISLWISINLSVFQLIMSKSDILMDDPNRKLSLAEYRWVQKNLQKEREMEAQEEKEYEAHLLVSVSLSI